VKLSRRALAFFLAAALLTLTAQTAEGSGRFSNAIGSDARTSAGLTHLTSNEIAVLDALVRRDASRLENATPSAPTFSQRLTVDEYRSAGLAHLTAVELVNLDALVASTETPLSSPIAATLLSPDSSRRDAASIRETTGWKPDVHGEVFIEFGGGRGLSERAGGIALTLEDPERRTAISVGYLTRRLDIH
jgi:hypothetical protein